MSVDEIVYLRNNIILSATFHESLEKSVLKIIISPLYANKKIVFFPPSFIASANSTKFLGDSVFEKKDSSNEYFFYVPFMEEQSDLFFKPNSLVANDSALGEKYVYEPPAVTLLQINSQIPSFKISPISQLSEPFFLGYAKGEKIKLSVNKFGTFQLKFKVDESESLCLLRFSDNLIWDRNTEILTFINVIGMDDVFVEIIAIPSPTSAGKSFSVIFDEAINPFLYKLFNDNNDEIIGNKIFQYQINDHVTNLSVSHPKTVEIEAFELKSTSTIRHVLSELSSHVISLNVISEDPEITYEIVQGSLVFSISGNGKIYVNFATIPGEYSLRIRISNRLGEHLFLNMQIQVLEPQTSLFLYNFGECFLPKSYEIISEIVSETSDCEQSTDDYLIERKKLHIGKKTRNLSFAEISMDIVSILEFIIYHTVSIEYEIKLSSFNFSEFVLLFEENATEEMFANYLLSFGPTIPSIIFRDSIDALSSEIYDIIKKFYCSFINDDNYQKKISSDSCFGKLILSRV